MAQALFDDHPIEHYLRDFGEIPELMPGGTDYFSRDPAHNDGLLSIPILRDWLPRLFNAISHVLEATGLRTASPASEFAERFKYVVISSPLLSSCLAASPGSRAPTPTTPGHYDHRPIATQNVNSPTTPAAAGSVSQFLAFSLACLVPAALAQGYYLSGIMIAAAVKLCAESLSLSLKSSRGDESWTATLETLEALVTANNAWDSVISDALGILENEEQNLLHPPSPSAASPSIRIALSSSLHTTQTQCDNVRQLLTALTSPLVLSQLSHMYAPPSPSYMTVPTTRTRPISLAAPSPTLHHSNVCATTQSLCTPVDDAYTRARSSPASQTFHADKRSTWNGSYMSLAGGPSPRRQKRGSNLSTTFRSEALTPLKSPTFSATVSEYSLQARSQPVPPVVEDASGDADSEDEPFGVAALCIRRKRRSPHVLILDAPSLSPNSAVVPSSSTTPWRSAGTPGSSQLDSMYGPPRSAAGHESPPTPSGSHFTSFSSTSSSRPSLTHPLTLSNLHLALQGALGSKRFACAHLLALRFSDSTSSVQRRLGLDTGSDTDGEDESYWEDVRSVISLLTSTLEDASARLAEALAETARQDQAQAQLTDEELCAESESESASRQSVESQCHTTLLSPITMQSFAPIPSHLTRFAAHVDAITSALDDAREHLRECVVSLRDSAQDTCTNVPDPDSTAVTLQSYERLRRELGLALRECERGRGTLLEIVQRVQPKRAGEVDDEESLRRHEDHFSSSESDKTMFNTDEVSAEHLKTKGTHEDAWEVHCDHDFPLLEDDATSHLISTATSQHLPPPGIEQVFESMAAPQSFTRERSKLTRDERIHMAKVHRESRFAVLGSVPGAYEGELQQAREGWGPGEEVVQELKDVIWKVSEQRRRMVDPPSPLS